jgi:hypothetical protein
MARPGYEETFTFRRMYDNARGSAKASNCTSIVGRRIGGTAVCLPRGKNARTRSDLRAQAVPGVLHRHAIENFVEVAKEEPVAFVRKSMESRVWYLVGLINAVGDDHAGVGVAVPDMHPDGDVPERESPGLVFQLDVLNRGASGS